MVRSGHGYAGWFPMVFRQIRVQPRQTVSQYLRRLGRTRNQSGVNSIRRRLRANADPAKRRIEIPGFGVMRPRANPCVGRDMRGIELREWVGQDRGGLSRRARM